MKTKATLFVLVVVSLAVVHVGKSSGIDSTHSHIQLLETGDFHGEEVTARSGEKWLGLYKTEPDAVLLPYRLKIDTIYDDLTDYEKGQLTGKRVDVDSPLKPLFLLKEATVLKEGPVITLYSAPQDFDKSLEKSRPINFKLNGTSYVLNVAAPEGAGKCRETAFPPEARLVLERGDSQQTLYSLEGCGNDPVWYLLWAGDLDHDGKLDLYVNVTQHYNVSEKRLFLSSQASQGELVKEVAEFITSGC
ncbi:MAG: hypothetical protein M3Y84_09420 [Acidobacteriota bacterium]|nr:hypothetical protein [Acidobacteriota bacterium]